jgi:phage-related protein
VVATSQNVALNVVLGLKDEATQKLGGITQKFGGLKTAVMGMAVGAAAGIAAVGTGIVKLAIDAAKIPEVERKFGMLTESINTTSDAMLTTLREATQSTVTDFDLMLQANKMMSMGLAGSSEEASKLAQVAYELGDPTQTVTSNMENLALMLANQSIPRLDSFGISGAAVKERIIELQEETEGMSRETAFMTAFLEQAEVSMERVGSREEDLAVQMAQMKATFQNVKDEVGMAFIPILSKLMGAIAPVITQLATGLIPIAEKVASFIANTLGPVIDRFGQLFKGVFEWVRVIFLDVKDAHGLCERYLRHDCESSNGFRRRYVWQRIGQLRGHS